MGQTDGQTDGRTDKTHNAAYKDGCITIDTDAVQIGSTLNSEFNVIAHHFKMVRYKGTTSSSSD